MEVIWEIKKETLKHARKQIRSPTWAYTDIGAIYGKKKFRRSHVKQGKLWGKVVG